MSLYTWLGNGSSEYTVVSSRYNYWTTENNYQSITDIDIYSLPCHESQIKVYTMPIQAEQIDEIVEKVLEEFDKRQQEEEESSEEIPEETENGEAE